MHNKYSSLTINLLSILKDFGIVRLRRDSRKYDKIVSEFKLIQSEEIKIYEGQDEFVVISRFPRTFLV
jgi:hypothetical protein